MIGMLWLAALMAHIKIHNKGDKCNTTPNTAISKLLPIYAMTPEDTILKLPGPTIDNPLPKSCTSRDLQLLAELQSKVQEDAEAKLKTNMKHVCPHCSYKTNITSMYCAHVLYWHEHDYSSLSLAWYKCENCSWFDFKDHLWADVSYKKLIKCDYCPYKAVRKFELDTHVFTRHINPKLLKLATNEYKYKYKQRKHVKRSTAKKKQDYKCQYCPYCPYKYKYQCYVENHVMFYHINANKLKVRENKPGYISN